MDKLHEISLQLSAETEDLLIARMAVSGLGMLANLDADTIGDLRIVTNECCDCLIHQPIFTRSLLIQGWIANERLTVVFTAQGKKLRGKIRRWTWTSSAAY